MSDQATSVTERLFQAGSPRDREGWAHEHEYYVAACGVSQTDIPQLIKLACKWSDPAWPDDFELGDSDDWDWDDIELLPVTAWRTLAELKCSESVDPLIGMLCDLEDADDWSVDELPHVFGKIGKAAIDALVRLANDDGQRTLARRTAADALQRVAEYHPETRTEIVAHLIEMMTKSAEREVELNSGVLYSLVQLQAGEAAEPIERAFAGNWLDVGLLGDWETVKKQLGVEGLGLEMPKHPHNSVEQFRSRMGIGIFSDRPVFELRTGKPDSGVEQAYYERACALFSQSQEAEQVVESCGELQWLRSFLEFGIHYRREVVDTMTEDSVGEYLFDYAPGKISTDAESAASMILELTKFWEYVQRVFDLPEAKSIIQWLNTDGLVDELNQDLANPENFSMAKSFFMAGMAAGYDMTSQQGLNEFMAAYNQSLGGPPASAEPVDSRKNRIGRNEPCPCGSGKKYKKCCLRSS